jgi:hypothetical protein
VIGLTRCLTAAFAEAGAARIGATYLDHESVVSELAGASTTEIAAQDRTLLRDLQSCCIRYITAADMHAVADVPGNVADCSTCAMIRRRWSLISCSTGPTHACSMTSESG